MRLAIVLVIKKQAREQNLKAKNPTKKTKLKKEKIKKDDVILSLK
jgi:hypothetical protein